MVEASSFSTIEKTPPLGLGYLIAFLRSDGHQVFFKDYYLSWSCTSDLEDFLQRKVIDLLAVSMNTICFAGGLLIIETAHKLRLSGRWSGKIAVGGPHPSVFPESIPEFVDYVVKGEGERKICEIASGAELSRLMDGIQVHDLDSLPFVPYEEFTVLPYNFTNQYVNAGRVFTMNTSRGCPFSCRFCSVSSIWGNRYRFQSAHRVIEEIKRMKRDYDAQGIYFREDNFTLNRKRVEAFCEGLLSADMKLTWFCETRANTLTKDLINLMSKAGCRGFYIGAESGSQRVLDYMRKGITLEQVKNAVGWAKEAGIRCYLSFVLGVPTETEEERYETLLFASKLNPHSFGISVFTGIPFSSSYWQLYKDRNYCMVTSGGIIYQKGHDELVNSFVGNSEHLVPKGIENAEVKLLPLLEKMSNVYTQYSGTTLILSVLQFQDFLAEFVRLLHSSLVDTDVLVLNCSEDDDVVLELTKLKEEPNISVKTLRKGQRIEALNYALELKSEFLIFAECLPELDVSELEFLREKLKGGADAVFFSVGGTTSIEELRQFKVWIEAGGRIDQSRWACRSRSFRDVGGCEKVYGDAQILNLVAKFIDGGLVDLVNGRSTASCYLNKADAAFFFEALGFRIGNQLLALSSLCCSRRGNATKISNVEEAVLSYFFGRVKMRARRFDLARKHFQIAIRKHFCFKYVVYWIATFMPSNSYSVIASLVNKFKKYEMNKG